ncbi:MULTISPECIES: type 2 periplasmic-binding domain-containing protein [Marinobacter]|uniref:Polar amino acid ABC transporter substrate-binding protein n=1 Tax=Marinobacter profundi TaxID=2666256 RepID=A0A2G1UGU5_9GAMM|nr:MULTISPECIES: transporter substrate-binding domain-containing protein [Marinobacter]MBD3655921.1 polar amino acid ABC transporter substrate-binding protein [Marinobacter sp.]MBI48296.1 polar amino acid ABC transporter substrate-binding protein [Marinobacter sp.]PHQ13650.1 polar amino acid ABC transporter substrate-binding protein [Marinobacter profundi]|tara:strand:- start:7201 stop:7917 length:717 start_codon:yes stop_codon:yes gene_type:complete
MRIGLFIITAFWFFPVSAQTLRIMGSDDGFLPFYYGNNLSMGILIEVINDFTLETGIEAEFRPMARKRQAWALQRGLANAVFASPLWMPLPDRMHAVGPVLTWRDRVFAQPGQQTDSFNDLEGGICLRKWFVYSDQLERGIGSHLVRHDAYNARQMLLMFLNKRCDYIVMNETEFRFLALLWDVDPDVYSTELIDAEWPVYLGILKTEADLIEAAEAFFANYTIDVAAMLPKLPQPDR